jgi:hypothetical protein
MKPATNGPGFSILTLFDVESIDIGGLESCVVADKRTWVRELTIRDVAGNRLRVGLYADSPDALALSEAEHYAAAESATAVTSLAELAEDVQP